MFSTTNTKDTQRYVFLVYMSFLDCQVVFFPEISLQNSVCMYMYIHTYMHPLDVISTLQQDTGPRRGEGRERQYPE
jgi:hypothetical protein